MPLHTYYRPTRRWLFGLLLILLSSYFGMACFPEPALAHPLPQDTTPIETVVPAPYLLWLLVGGSGMFGGFLFGLKNRKLVLPHWESKHVIEPGCLGDCLFGLAGGYVVFILLPGDFNFMVSSWEIVKIVAVAVVGGYAGRALVEKVLAQQFYELESDLRQLRQQNKQGAQAIALLRQHFDDNLDTPPIPEEELKQAILDAPASVKVLAFDMAQAYRNEHYENQPELIIKTIPIFEALIEDDREQKFHRNHGELGYVYKDKPQPDWRRAETELSRAIEIRDKERVDGFLLYELNRAICRIKLGAGLETIISDLNKVLQRGPKNGEWVRRPDRKKAKVLIEWLKQNQEHLREWIQANNIHLPDGAERN